MREPEAVSAPVVVETSTAAPPETSARDFHPSAQVETPVASGQVEERTTRDFAPDGPGERAAEAAMPTMLATSPVAHPAPSAPVLPAEPERTAPETMDRATMGTVAPSPSVATDAASALYQNNQEAFAGRERFQGQPRQEQGGQGQGGQGQGGQPPDNFQGRQSRFDRQGRQGRRERYQQGGGQGQGQGNNPQQQGGQRDFQGQNPPRDGRDNRDFQGQGQGQGRDNRGFQGQRDPRDNRDGQQAQVGPGQRRRFVSRPAEVQFGEGIVEVSGKALASCARPSAVSSRRPPTCSSPRKSAASKPARRPVDQGRDPPQLARAAAFPPDRTQRRGPGAVQEPAELRGVDHHQPEEAHPARNRSGALHDPRDGPLMTPHRQGPARPAGRAAAHRQTTMLQHIAEAVVKNHPEMKLIILLVDERPEEVTEMRRAIPQAEIMASSNDSDLKNHTRIAQLAMERSKRLVEAGFDVFMLLDSITRMGRAFNNSSAGGRTGSGGIDNRALEIPRKIFAAARNTEEAGSLTIMATALIDTGQPGRRGDLPGVQGHGQHGTGAGPQDQRPAHLPGGGYFQSGTRREELLLQPWELDKINVIRRGLAGHKPLEAIERLLSFLKKFPTNAQMLTSCRGDLFTRYHQYHAWNGAKSYAREHPCGSSTASDAS